jgi:hypothetical protein
VVTSGGSICRAFTLRGGSCGRLFDLEGVGIVLEHLPPEPGALAGVDVDVVRLGEAPATQNGISTAATGGLGNKTEGRGKGGSQVRDVGLGEDAGDAGGLHDHVGAVGLDEGLVVVEAAEAERGREGGERERGGDLGVDRVGEPARALEPAAPGGVRLHGALLRWPKP